MVSISLTMVKKPRENEAKKRSASAIGGRSNRISVARMKALLAILLDAGGAQARETMLVNRELPGKKFVDRQRVSAASFLEGKKAAADSGNDFSFTADNPPFGSGCRQVG